VRQVIHWMHSCRLRVCIFPASSIFRTPRTVGESTPRPGRETARFYSWGVHKWFVE
jgi:hypothetical protein